jgi:hypothetical protein
MESKKIPLICRLKEFKLRKREENRDGIDFSNFFSIFIKKNQEFSKTLRNSGFGNF